MDTMTKLAERKMNAQSFDVCSMIGTILISIWFFG